MQYRRSTRSGTSATRLNWLLSDHLGSASLTADPLDGDKLSELRYKAWGETRYALTSLPTDRRFTGQVEEAGIGLYFFNARWYDSALGRWAQPDSIVPVESQGVQAWDRYAFVNNNPIRYNDPSGHDVGCGGRDASACASRKIFPTTIAKPFYDPDSDVYGSVTTNFTVADPPHDFDDPYGEASPSNNRLDQIVRGINFLAFSLQNFINAALISEEQPNAEITVFYNAYGAINPTHEFGLEVPGMWVINNSDTELILQNGSFGASQEAKTHIYFGSKIIPSGGFTSVNINSPNFQTDNLEILIYMLTSSGTPVFVEINAHPFELNK